MSDDFANFVILHSRDKNIAVDRPMVKYLVIKTKQHFNIC